MKKFIIDIFQIHEEGRNEFVPDQIASVGVEGINCPITQSKILIREAFNNNKKQSNLGKVPNRGGGLPGVREFPTFLTGKTVMNGKFPKHPETSRKAIQILIEKFDLLKVPKFTRGEESQRFGTFPKFDRFLVC